MHFVVHALDKPDAAPLRAAHIDAHRAYLAEAPARHGVVSLMSGPLMDDAGDAMIGSFFLLAARSRRDIAALFDADPLQKAGIWRHVSISRVAVRVNAVGPLEDVA